MSTGILPRLSAFPAANRDLALVAATIGILVILFAPIPPALLDLAIIANFGLALTIMLLTFYVGKPVEVNPDILRSFLGSDFIPVVAPIGAGRGGETFNVNGDTAAGAIAAAMKADRLLLLTDVAGVKDADGAVLTALRAADVRELTASGVIAGGMIPKTQTALDAL